MTSGRQQPNCTDSFCRTVVSSHWRRSTCGGSRQQYWEGQKIYREETWLCQKHFELQQNVSRTYPDIRLFQFCYDFCDTSSDHCDTRTILQRTKIHQKLFVVSDGLDGWREANGLAHICINRDYRDIPKVDLNRTIRSFRSSANSIVVCLCAI